MNKEMKKLQTIIGRVRKLQSKPPSKKHAENLINAFKKDIEKQIKEHPKSKILTRWTSKERVFDLIKEYFDQNGELLTVDETLNHVLDMSKTFKKHNKRKKYMKKKKLKLKSSKSVKFVMPLATDDKRFKAKIKLLAQTHTKRTAKGLINTLIKFVTLAS